LTPDLGFILVGPLPSLEIRRLFFYSTRPILGCTDQVTATSLLWASGGLAVRGPESEFGILAVLWALVGAT
jgi:hypothetical protein